MSSRSVSRAWGAIALIGLAGFLLLLGLVGTRTVIPFDQPLLDLGRSFGRFADVWNLISNSANLPMIAIGVGLVLSLFLAHRRRDGILVIVVLAAVTAGSEGVKLLIARPRPPGSDTVVPGVVYSFPSGHVLEAVTILGIIALLVWRSGLPGWARAGLAIAVTIFVALVAVARVALNAHYPSDVLAGFLAGIAVLALFALLTAPRRRTPPRRDP
ncbi:MAG: phosphatase PAP2 family protein [Chloroflexi bacterium]|nr:phosphatase PAP2 family protein [Chloroflexota bacterium]